VQTFSPSKCQPVNYLIVFDEIIIWKSSQKQFSAHYNLLNTLKPEEERQKRKSVWVYVGGGGMFLEAEIK
jgi:hypothetical protein